MLHAPMFQIRLAVFRTPHNQVGGGQPVCPCDNAPDVPSAIAAEQSAFASALESGRKPCGAAVLTFSPRCYAARVFDFSILDGVR